MKLKRVGLTDIHDHSFAQITAFSQKFQINISALRWVFKNIQVPINPKDCFIQYPI